MTSEYQKAMRQLKRARHPETGSEEAASEDDLQATRGKLFSFGKHPGTAE